MLSLLLLSSALAVEPYRVNLIDKVNRWPVPLVELRTTDGQRFVSDNAGVIAIDSPDLMNRETWFDVIGHGYDVPKDGFGYRGIKLTPVPASKKTVELTRTIIAERIGRLTGSGLFAESQKCALERDWKDSPIVGCDSVQSVEHDGRQMWFWGDTTLPGYPLGLFHTLGASTAKQPFKRLEPPLRPSFDYITDAVGKPRGVAVMPGNGPTWLFGVTTVPDKNGKTQLVGCYTKIENHLDVHTVGLCVWEPGEKQFQPHRTIWTKADGGKPPTKRPDGHAMTWKDTNSDSWLLFGNPFPHLKCRATFEAWGDPSQWEAVDTPKALTGPKGEKVVPHTGSIAYSAWRRKWITVFTQKFGTSPFGEVWSAEADSPLGPWGQAIKVLSHDNYTFYNPKIHADLDRPGSVSNMVFFEGTYSAEFADHAAPTPRHNYNQIFYRLNLENPTMVTARGK